MIHILGTNLFAKIKTFYSNRSLNAWILLAIVIYVIFVIKLVTLQTLDTNLFFGVYSIVVTLYILSRFVLAYFYLPEPFWVDKKYEPTISFGVPSKNEGENINTLPFI